MMFQLSISDKVKYCPSVAGIVDGSTYIIGCYQLVDGCKQTNLSHDQLIKINNRLGCLLLIKSSKVIFEYDCVDGGVFDLAVVQTNDSSNDQNYQFWAAHSNGSVACYYITNGSIKLIKSIISGSSMLCSLTILNDLVFVGDSESKVIAVQKDKVIAECKLDSTPYGGADPVWCLKTIYLDPDKFIIISGSEDSQLRFHFFQSGSFSQATKVVKDFTAGVTSIAIIDKPDTNDEGDQTFDYILYVGSYDETIRIYNLNIADEGPIGSTSIQLVLNKKIHISGSGIWKIIPVKSNQPWPYMLTASMYAGAHILQQYSILAEIKLNLLDSQGVEASEMSSEHASNKPNHLIYGVAGINNCNEIIVTSFYDKSFHIFHRCNN